MNDDDNNDLYTYLYTTGRQGGKLKPLKQPKKAAKQLDDDDVSLYIYIHISYIVF